MITLLTTFLLLLFTFEQPTQTACQAQLNQLHDTYRFPLLWESEIIKQTSEIAAMQQTLNCFKQIAVQDSQKVLLVTTHTLDKNQCRGCEKYSTNMKAHQFDMEKILKVYNLPADETYFIQRNYNASTQNLSQDSLQVELIDFVNDKPQLDYKVRFEINLPRRINDSIPDCPSCPFCVLGKLKLIIRRY